MEQTQKQDVMKFLDEMSRGLDGDYRLPGMPDYLKRLEENLEYGYVSKDEGNASIKPSFFRENYKNSRDMFQAIAYHIKHGSEKMFLIRSGDLKLDINGRDPVSTLLYKKDRLVCTHDTSIIGRRIEDTPDAAEAFVVLAANKKRIRRGIYQANQFFIRISG